MLLTPRMVVHASANSSEKIIGNRHTHIMFSLRSDEKDHTSSWSQFHNTLILCMMQQVAEPHSPPKKYEMSFCGLEVCSLAKKYISICRNIFTHVLRPNFASSDKLQRKRRGFPEPATKKRHSYRDLQQIGFSFPSHRMWKIPQTLKCIHA